MPKKWLVFAGYGLGVVSKPFFAMAGAMPVVFGARLFDRIGKGLRGAPRDAIVAEVTPKEILGAAYGLRQSLDAAGAFVGPALASLLLFLWAADFRTIFWAALIPGICCLILILVGVEEKAAASSDARPVPRPWRDFFTMESPALRSLVLLGVLFSLARFSNAFIVLRAADAGIAVALIPLIMVGMNLVFSLASYPFGRLADKLSPVKLLVLGLLLLMTSDAVFALWATPAGIGLGVVLWGLHLGATQGIFSVMIARTAPADRKATAFGIFNFFSGIAMLAAGLIAGILWESVGPAASFGGGALFAAVSLALLTSRRFSALR
ncbi:MAG: MFS transporter [Sutterella sp.]|nr:MFS transporter [Sutterella sp.]